jgi:hypothetical protein
MTEGLRTLPGFIPTIREGGLGAGAGLGGRCGFAGVSKDVAAGTFVSLKSAADVKEKLGRGPAVEQLLDFFEDGFDGADQKLSVQEVIYREIDPTGGTAANIGQTAGAGNSGNATVAVGGTPWLDRVYNIEVTQGGEVGAARYKICRNYGVVDIDHQIWSEELKFVVTDTTSPQKCQIYLEAAIEDPDNGAYIEFTEDTTATDFVAGDNWTITATAVVPTQANVEGAITALAQWRDTAGNGLGGTGDISFIGCDQQVAPGTNQVNWKNIHQIATDEWDNNIHPVQIIVSVDECDTTGAPAEYDIDTWVSTVVSETETYRGTTIPGNDLLNGALVINAVYLLRDLPRWLGGAQVRHQGGAVLGQALRSPWHWDIGWVEKYGFRGGLAVYPWNSKTDNMTVKPLESALENRTATLTNDGHVLAAFPRAGTAVKIVTSDFWAMAETTSDYFKAPYYRIVGGTHVVLRTWFTPYTREPGISADDAAALEAEIQGTVLKPRIVDPSKPGDAIAKPYNDAKITVWAEADVLVTEELDYALVIVPTGSKRQLTGWTQLRRSI